jgi:hypothetical protein
MVWYVTSLSLELGRERRKIPCMGPAAAGQFPPARRYASVDTPMPRLNQSRVKSRSGGLTDDPRASRAGLSLDRLRLQGVRPEWQGCRLEASAKADDEQDYFIVSPLGF